MPAATAAPQPWSFSLDAFVEGGGIQNSDIRIKDAKFHIWQYPNRPDSEQIFCQLDVDILEAGKAVREAEQQLSVAKLGYGEISEDGHYSIPGEKSNPGAKTNLHVFLQSLASHGMPLDYMGDGDISRLIGIECHVDTIKKPKVEGDQFSGGNAFLCTEIYSGPWDAKKRSTGRGTGTATAAKSAAGAGAKSKGSAAAAASNDGDDEAQAQAMEMLVEFLTTNGPTKAVLLFPSITRLYSKHENWAAVNSYFKAGALTSLVAATGGSVVIDSGVVQIEG